MAKCIMNKHSNEIRMISNFLIFYLKWFDVFKLKWNEMNSFD